MQSGNKIECLRVLNKTYSVHSRLRGLHLNVIKINQTS